MHVLRNIGPYVSNCQQKEGRSRGCVQIVLYWWAFSFLIRSSQHHYSTLFHKLTLVLVDKNSPRWIFVRGRGNLAQKIDWWHQFFDLTYSRQFGGTWKFKKAVLEHFFDQDFLRPLKTQNKSEYEFVWGISSSWCAKKGYHPLPQ